jgi:hypothetical protein
VLWPLFFVNCFVFHVGVRATIGTARRCHGGTAGHRSGRRITTIGAQFSTVALQSEDIAATIPV